MLFVRPSKKYNLILYPKCWCKSTEDGYMSSNDPIWTTKGSFFWDFFNFLLTNHLIKDIVKALNRYHYMYMMMNCLICYHWNCLHKFGCRQFLPSFAAKIYNGNIKRVIKGIKVIAVINRIQSRDKDQTWKIDNHNKEHRVTKIIYTK